MTAADPAGGVAQALTAAGWPVIPMRIDTDEKAPAARWSDGSGLIWEAREIDPAWPRWATVCGVRRADDGAALVCLDADTDAEAERARRMLPSATRVRTGKGEHTWMILPADADDRLRARFLVNDGGLDWRGGRCIVLLPGSLYRPTSSHARYAHISGPPIQRAALAPDRLLTAVLSRAPGPSRAQVVSPTHGGSGLPYAVFLDLWADAVGAARVRENRHGDASGPCPSARHSQPVERRGDTSLHVTDGGDRVLVHCLSRGCSYADVLTAIEPRWRSSSHGDEIVLDPL